MNPDLYPNPEQFNPENFSAEAIDKRSKYSFLAFSKGIRDCIGTESFSSQIQNDSKGNTQLIQIFRQIFCRLCRKTNCHQYTKKIQAEYKFPDEGYRLHWNIFSR